MYIGYLIYRGQSRSHVVVILCITAFTTYWSSQLAFPAGAFSPDTPTILSGIEQSYNANEVVETAAYSHTPIQLIIIIQSAMILGLPFEFIYVLLSTLLVVSVIPLIITVDQKFPSIERKTALYSALFFSIASFTLNRGLFPHKTNFFKPLILLLILSFAYAYFSRRTRSMWVLIASVSYLALLSGHTYSAGAPILVASAFLIYWGLNWLHTRLSTVSDEVISGFPSRMIIGLSIAFLSYSIFVGGGITNRIARIIISIFGVRAGGSGAGGSAGPSGSAGGRYAELSIELLLFSTSGQMFLFALSTLGIVLAFKRSEFDLDMVLSWVVFGFGLIAFGLFVNAVDIPVQRIYSLLTLFGLNIMMALAFDRLLQGHEFSWRKPAAFSLLFLCAIAFLASPIAGMALSPLNDEIPHNTRYETAATEQGMNWINSEIDNEDILQGSELPLIPTANSKEVKIDDSRLKEGEKYAYSYLSVRSGIKVPTNRDFRAFGGTELRFLEKPSVTSDNKIYANSEVEVYIHRKGRNHNRKSLRRGN